MDIEEYRKRFPDIDPLFLDICDDCSPIGNDTGADVFAFYEEWRNNGGKPREFLDSILKDWKVKTRYWEHSDDELKIELEKDYFSILTKDDAAIGTAFAQYFIDGKIDYVVKRKALISIERQMKDFVIEFRGWVSPQERKDTLIKMETFIKNETQLTSESNRTKKADGFFRRLFKRYV